MAAIETHTTREGSSMKKKSLRQLKFMGQPRNAKKMKKQEYLIYLENQLERAEERIRVQSRALSSLRGKYEKAKYGLE